jgi:hypothetical protein
MRVVDPYLLRLIGKKVDPEIEAACYRFLKIDGCERTASPANLDAVKAILDLTKSLAANPSAKDKRYIPLKQLLPIFGDPERNDLAQIADSVHQQLKGNDSGQKCAATSFCNLNSVVLKSKQLYRRYRDAGLREVTKAELEAAGNLTLDEACDVIFIWLAQNKIRIESRGGSELLVFVQPAV